MSPGSTPIHGLERAHNALVRDDGLESEAHRTDINDPVDLEWIEVANNLCSRLKCCLWRFTGMLLQNIQARQMGPDRKGGAPLPDSRQDLP